MCRQIFLGRLVKIFIGMLIVFTASTVNAEVKPFTGVGKYIMSDFDSQSIAKERARVRAEKNAKDQAGVYLTSFSRAVNFKLTQQEIFAITNNITNVIGDIDYSQEIFNVDNSNKSQVIEWTAKLNANINTNGINDWLERYKQSKDKIINQNENTRKAQDENNKRFHALKKEYDSATSSQEKDRIKKEIEQVDIEFLAIQKLEEGNRFYYNGEYDRAIAAYNEAIELNPNDYDAYNSRACAYDEQGEYDKAIQNYNRAIELNPNDADIYNNRGVAYYNISDIHRAFLDYNQAIKLNPNDPKVYVNRGVAYRKTGDYDKAIADYNQAIKLNPDFVEAYNNRGVVYYDIGDINRAIADFKKAMKINPNYVSAKNNLDFVLAKKAKN